MSAATDPPTRAAYVESDDAEKSYYGDGNDVSVEFDPNEGTNGALVVYDEANNQQIAAARVGGTNEFVVDADLTVTGTTTQVDDIVTTDVSVEDSNNNAQFTFDGDAATPFFEIATGNNIRYPQDAGVQTLVDMAVSSSPTAGTEQSVSLNVDGTGGVKVYAEADGAGGIQNQRTEVLNGDLRVPTGSAIEDGGGTSRISILSGETRISGQNGANLIRILEGTTHRLGANSTTPLQIYDREGGFTAVQYNTDTSAGRLQLANAGLNVQQGHSVGSIQGYHAVFSGGQTFLTSQDGNGNPTEIEFDGSLYDFTGNAANLRLAAGQAIADGGGTPRVTLASNRTDIRDEASTTGIQVADGRHVRLYAESDRDISFYDTEGGFEATKYTTSASAPGKIELTNAILNMSSQNIEGFVRIVGSPNANTRLSIDGNNTYLHDQFGGNSLRINAGANLFDISQVANNLRIATGQAIEDGAGTNRLVLTSGNSGGTDIRDNAGNTAFRADVNASETAITVRSARPFRLEDNEGSFNAVTYITSASAPGTLALPGADLDGSESAVQTGSQIDYGNPTSVI